MAGNTYSDVGADFFGKDGMVPFVGVVEDVNDPKKSGRVKVRCVGWHPKEKEGGDETGDALTTDELPWARVGMPVTHPQQSRVGGKHGLLPGCWVMGFFLDGVDAQDPFIMNTFSFTSKASEQDYRAVPEGQDGKHDLKDKAFDKNVVSPKTIPSIDTRMASEREQKGTSNPLDPSGDNTLDDSDAFCPEADETQGRSVASERRQRVDFKGGEIGNAESQQYQTIAGDGLGGSVAHAQADIQRRLRERMPSAFARELYNDVVFNRFTGAYINFNGILAQLALEIGNLLKGPANSMKAFTERTANRPLKSTTIQVPDRDGKTTKELDEGDTEKGDLFHALFQETVIDTLIDTIFNLLKVLDGAGNPLPPDSVLPPQTTNTTITNFDALCLSEQLINNFEAIVEEAITTLLELIFGDGGGGGSLDDLNNIVNQFAGLAKSLKFPLMQKYALVTKVFNRAGSRSGDIRNKEIGFNPERIYDTQIGFIKDYLGQTGPGAQGSGADSYDWTKIQFGGTANPTTGEVSNIPCSDAELIGVPVPVIGGLPIVGGGSGRVDPKEWGLRYDFSGVKIVPRDFAEPDFPVNWEKIEFKPGGYNARIIARSLPASDPCNAANFERGVPNVLVILDTGVNYFYGDILGTSVGFPSIYIPGYNGTPIPVIDRQTGEFVGVQVECTAWNPQDGDPTVAVIPDKSSVGLASDDPTIDIQLGNVYIANTGFAYEDPKFVVIDRDTGEENGKVAPVIQNGRIVDLEVIDQGRNFKRIPEIRLVNANQDPGYGADFYPIMSILPREGVTDSRALVDLVYCPAKNQINFRQTTS